MQYSLKRFQTLIQVRCSKRRRIGIEMEMEREKTTQSSPAKTVANSALSNEIERRTAYYNMRPATERKGAEATGEALSL